MKLSVNEINMIIEALDLYVDKCLDRETEFLDKDNATGAEMWERFNQKALALIDKLQNTPLS